MTQPDDGGQPDAPNGAPQPAPSPKPSMSRRNILFGSAGVLAAGGAATWAMRRKLKRKLAQLTEDPAFSATPGAPVHDPVRDATKLYVAQGGGGPAERMDALLANLGGAGAVVGTDDVVIIKVAAQWWNQGMTNVAAVRRAIEHILEVPGFRGDVIVFENAHFRFLDRADDDPHRGLTRAWTFPSVRNVDVPGWTCLGDLIPHFARLGAPVGFVGLVDAGLSSLQNDTWHDPEHKHGFYGGDGRGPLGPGDVRDGYFWDFDNVFRLKRSMVDYAQVPLTWPRFTDARSGLTIDLRDGVFKRQGNALVKVDRKLTFINMTTGNEHGSTGYTGAVKSAMGLVDMSAGALGTHPLVREYQSVHYFGSFGKKRPSWRMAGPLAAFCANVRKPDLYITVSEWTAAMPATGWTDAEDLRHAEMSAHPTRTIVAGTDPVAVDAWCIRNLLMPIKGLNFDAYYDLDSAEAKATKFLRYYKEVAGVGALDPALHQVNPRAIRG